MSEKESSGQDKKLSIKKVVIWFVVIIIVLLVLGIILPAIPRMVKRSVPYRLVCGTQMTNLGKYLLIYSCGDGPYPTADRWCDLLIEHTDVAEGDFRHPGNKKERCGYAINPNVSPRSNPRMVLLFETKGGWNQYGGAEILSFDNHQGRGFNVLFNDQHVEFVETEEVGDLNWGEKEKGRPEMEMAVRTGKAALVEEGYELAEYRLVGVSNEYWKGPEHWTVTFKPDRLLAEGPANTPVGTGGEVFVHVNVKSEEWYLTFGE